MPLEITIDSRNRLIMMRGSGVLTDSDLVQAHNECDTNPAADPSFVRICDLSAVTDVSISAESLDAWAASSVSNPPVRHAVICSAAPILKRVLEYVQLSRKQFREVSVFPTYDQASEWIRKD